MSLILTIIYIILCILLVIVILIQQDKSSGGGLGAAFGGSSQTVFGSSSGDILSKVTVYLTVGFMVLSLLLTFVFTRKSSLVQKEGTIDKADTQQQKLPTKTEKNK